METTTKISPLAAYLETRIALQQVFAKTKRIKDFGTCDDDNNQFKKWLVKMGLPQYQEAVDFMETAAPKEPTGVPVVPAEVKGSKFGCANCLWASCECKNGSKYVPSTYKGEKTCGAYTYCD